MSVLAGVKGETRDCVRESDREKENDKERQNKTKVLRTYNIQTEKLSQPVVTKKRWATKECEVKILLLFYGRLLIKEADQV